MQIHRRLCALVVLALVAGVPPNTPRGCVQCPPGCPMHARRADGDGGGDRHKPGCHRAPVTPSGTVCVRSGCGHDAITESPVALRTVLAERASVPITLASVPLAPAVESPSSLAAPEPPTHPPRRVYG